MYLQRLHYRLFSRRHAYEKSLYLNGGSSPRRVRGINPVFLLLIGLLFGILALFFVAASRLSPILAAFGRARAEYIATNAIYEGIRDTFSAGVAEYHNLTTIEKNAEGNVIAIRTDSAAINLLKSEVSLSIAEKLRSIGETPVKVPIGNLLDGELLSGRGPKIEIKLLPYGSVTTEFENVLTSAGINQSRHQVLVKVTALVGIVFPTGHENVEVKTAMTVAETVIVGAVPDSFTYVEDPESPTRGRIFDYALNR